MAIPVLGYAAVGVWRNLALGNKEIGIAMATTPHRLRKNFFMSVFLDPRSVREILTFGAAGFFASRMEREVSAINAAETELDRERARTRMGIAVVGALAQSAALGYATVLVARADMSVGVIVLVVAALSGMLGALESLMGHMRGLLVSLRFYDAFEALASEPDETPTWELPYMNGLADSSEVRVQGLSFSYSSSHSSGFSP